MACPSSGDSSMNIRNKNSVSRSLANKKNRNRILSRLKYVSLCLGVLICGVVLAYNTMLKTHNRDNTSNLEVTGPITQLSTKTAAPYETRMNSYEAMMRKQPGSTRKDVRRAAARHLPRRPASRIASASKPYEFQKAILESLAHSDLNRTKGTEVVGTPVSESAQPDSASEIPLQTTAQKSTASFPTAPSSDAKPRWIPPANRRGIVGPSPESNKDSAI